MYDDGCMSDVVLEPGMGGGDGSIDFSGVFTTG
jgi:hypothetical protein